MTWNYRVIDFGTHMALHEVYYDEHGHPTSYTKEPVSFVVDQEEGRAGIISSLRMALNDCESPIKLALKPGDFRK